MRQRDIKILEQKAMMIRKEIIEMAYRAGTGHIGSALSLVDILTALYFRILSIHPRRPRAEDRDRFILSKGHGVAAPYAVLSRRGFFPPRRLKEYLTDGSVFSVHPVSGGIPGIELSTGSLGHGLSVGVGMARAAKRDGRAYRIIVLLSDVECDEGSAWEAAMAAAQWKLDNVTAIIDYDKLQALGRVRDVMNLEPFVDKWKSFGATVREVDGHDMSQIVRLLERIPFKRYAPNVVIAHTTMGKGVSFMEDRLEWHYNSMTDEQYQLAMEELKTS